MEQTRTERGSVASIDSALTLYPSATFSTKYSRQGSVDAEDLHLIDSPADINFAKDFNAAQYEFPGWPQRPEQLKKIRHRMKHAACDIVMAGVALLWLVYAAYVYCSDGKSAHEKETKLVEAGRIGTTIFPYVFAAILSRFLSAVARWRLEIGAEVMTIDQLFASTTIFHTIKTIWRLRAINLLGLGLFLVWILSPIGSQATQRVATLRMKLDNTTAPLTWMDTGSAYRWLGPDYVGMHAAVAATQSAAMIASQRVKDSSCDEYNNLKVPMLESLNATAGTDWVSLPNNVIPTYSSLIGIPIAERSILESTSFTFTATYWHASCSDLTYTPAMRPINGTPSALTNFSTSQYASYSANNSLWQIAVATRDTNDTIQPPLPFVLEVAGQDDQAQFTLAHMSCNLTTSDVELQASCEGVDASTCSITAMRNSPQHQPNTFTPPLALGTTSDPQQVTLARYFKGFAGSFFALASAGPSSTPFERFLATNLKIMFSKTGSYTTVTNVTELEFGDRISQLFNTYWLSSTGYSSIIHGLNETATPSYEQKTYSPQVLHGERVVHTNVQYLHCERMWFALLMISSGILFVASIAAAILRFFLEGPNVLDLVSAMTMPNALRVPTNGGYMDGAERSRLLRRKRIRLGDGASGDIWGKIVVGDERRVKGFDEERLYV